MIRNLSSFLSTGLVKSDFVNLKIRKLSAETSHEFIEWCGLTRGSENNDRLVTNQYLLCQDLYADFIQENTDYGPRGKMSISKTKFYRWLIAYGLFLTGRNPEQSKSSQGKTIMFIDETQEENQKADTIDIPF